MTTGSTHVRSVTVDDEIYLHAADTAAWLLDGAITAEQLNAPEIARPLRRSVTRILEFLEELS